MVNRSRRRTNKSKPRRAKSTTRSTRAPRKSTTRSRRATARKSRREQARERRGSTTRRASRASRRTSKASKRRADVVSDVLSSTLGLGDMFKDDEKGYTNKYRVNKKFGKKESVSKKRRAKPPKIPRNNRGKKIKSDDSDADADSFLAGIESSGNKKRRAKPAKRSKKGASPYNKFVKEQSPIIKAENPGLTQPEIMKLIGKKWKEQKP